MTTAGMELVFRYWVTLKPVATGWAMAQDATRARHAAASSVAVRAIVAQARYGAGCSRSSCAWLVEGSYVISCGVQTQQAVVRVDQGMNALFTHV